MFPCFLQEHPIVFWIMYCDHPFCNPLHFCMLLDSSKVSPSCWRWSRCDHPKGAFYPFRARQQVDCLFNWTCSLLHRPRRWEQSIWCFHVSSLADSYILLFQLNAILPLLWNWLTKIMIFNALLWYDAKELSCAYACSHIYSALYRTVPLNYSSSGRNDFYPTVFLLWRCPHALRSFVIHAPVSSE